PELHTLSLHDALPISSAASPPTAMRAKRPASFCAHWVSCAPPTADETRQHDRKLGQCEALPSPSKTSTASSRSCVSVHGVIPIRSEEHTSELQSRENL